MKNINIISVKDFWKKYSKDSILFSKHPDLPLKLNLTMFFDNYFGKLTQHDFITVNNNDILLECKNCVHVANIRPDICSAHIGIIIGQFENLFDTEIILENTISKNICTIKIYE